MVEWWRLVADIHDKCFCATCRSDGTRDAAYNHHTSTHCGYGFCPICASAAAAKTVGEAPTKGDGASCPTEARPPGEPKASDGESREADAERPTAEREASGQFTKGHTRLGGREPGTPNKVNQHTKELIQAFVEHGMAGAQDVYDRLVARQPRAALTVLSRFTEFAAPKLARTELTGEDGGPVVVERRIHDSSDKDKE